MSETLGDLVDDSVLEQLASTYESIKEWWEAPETQRKVRRLRKNLNDWVNSAEFRRGMEVLAGFISLYKKAKQRAEERGVSVEEYFEGFADKVEDSPVNAALGLSFKDFSETFYTALLHEDSKLTEEIVEFSLSKDVLGELEQLVEAHGLVDEHSERSFREFVNCIEDENFVAAHRTLFPEIERFVVNVGVQRGILNRTADGVEYKSADGRPRGFVNKAEKVAKELPQGDDVLNHLKAHWQEHMNATRHGETSRNRSPKLLTADAIFVYHSMLTLMPEKESVSTQSRNTQKKWID